MADFTVNTVTTKGGWEICDAYNTDASDSKELLAAVTGQEYLIKSLSFEINDNDKWLKLFDDTTLRIGPVRSRSNNYYRSYESPIRISGAVNIQTESNDQVHITIAYKKRTITT